MANVSCGESEDALRRAAENVGISMAWKPEL